MRKTLLTFVLLLVAGGMWNKLPADTTCVNHVCDHKHGIATSELGPVLRLDLRPRTFCCDLGYSALGEVGNNDYRINGTVGGVLCPCHLVKFSAEYLGQRLAYNFDSGKVKRWMHQSAVGGKYKYLVDCRWIDSIEFGGTYSYAKSRKLRDFVCPQVTTSSLITHKTVSRHIAGSHAYSISGGATILPWCDAWLTADLVYDHVEYDRKFQHHRETVAGVGATFRLTQRFWNDFALILTADFRRPFNYSEALVSWTTWTNCGLLDLGVFAGYTEGKSHLPNSSTYGIELGYSFGPANCESNCCDPCDPCCDQQLLCWLGTPAVRMPQVLAISDQRVTVVNNEVCNLPTSVPIPNQFVPEFSSLSFNVSPYFSANGNTITFSMIGLPVGFTIDPITGIITGNNPTAFEDLVFPVTVTATTICGSTSQTFFVTLQGGSSE